MVAMQVAMYLHDDRWAPGLGAILLTSVALDHLHPNRGHTHSCPNKWAGFTRNRVRRLGAEFGFRDFGHGHPLNVSRNSTSLRLSHTQIIHHYGCVHCHAPTHMTLGELFGPKTNSVGNSS